MKVRLLLAAALTLGSTGLTALVGAPAAHAEQWCAWNPDTGGWYRNTTMNGPYNTYNLYTGNSSSCAKTGATVSEGAAIKLYCVEPNNANNWWAYIKTSSGAKGWVSLDNVQYNEIVAMCSS
ncbi:hypothetical protein ACFWBG_30230 [Nocardia salmonicida]|uniref:hypothetical protein n=1 Tax=Nocardia salmonicida TaxID=53431 RepID=UPI00367235E4